MPQHQFEEFEGMVNDEIQPLPTKYRDPLLLVHFRHLHPDHAAEQVRCLPATFRKRLSRARALLRERLVRRGILLSSALLEQQLNVCNQSPTHLQISEATSSIINDPSGSVFRSTATQQAQRLTAHTIQSMKKAQRARLKLACSTGTAALTAVLLIHLFVVQPKISSGDVFAKPANPSSFSRTPILKDSGERPDPNTETMVAAPRSTKTGLLKKLVGYKGPCFAMWLGHDGRQAFLSTVAGLQQWDPIKGVLQNRSGVFSELPPETLHLRKSTGELLGVTPFGVFNWRPGQEPPRFKPFGAFEQCYAAGFDESGDRMLLAHPSHDKNAMEIALWVKGQPIYRKTCVLFGRLRYGGNGAFAIIVGQGGDIGLWDVFEGQLKHIHEGPGHDNPAVRSKLVVCDAVLTRDQAWAIAANEPDGRVVLWDTATWSIRKEFDRALPLTTNGNLEARLHLSEDGSRLLGHGDAVGVQLLVWDVESRTCHRILSGHEGAVSEAAISPDGNMVLSCSTSDELFLWRCEGAISKQPSSTSNLHNGREGF